MYPLARFTLLCTFCARYVYIYLCVCVELGAYVYILGDTCVLMAGYVCSCFCVCVGAGPFVLHNYRGQILEYTPPSEDWLRSNIFSKYLVYLI